MTLCRCSKPKSATYCGEPLAGGTITTPSKAAASKSRDPLNDSRTATVTVSVYDKAAQHARALDRVLSVTYGPYLVFKGQILQVSTDFAAGTVPDQCAGPQPSASNTTTTGYGDRAVNVGYPIDGLGMRRLIESAIPTQSELAAASPRTASCGARTPSPTPARNPRTSSNPEAGDGLWRNVERGANVWETVRTSPKPSAAPNSGCGPIDRDPPRRRPRRHCRPGSTAKSTPTNSPAKCPTRRWWCSSTAPASTTPKTSPTNPTGTWSATGSGKSARAAKKTGPDHSAGVTAQKKGSQEDFGLMEGWESSGQDDSMDVLARRRRRWSTSYGRPPDYFSVTPRIDAATQVPQFPVTSWSATSSAPAPNGACASIDLIGRVIDATLNAVDQAANAARDVDCAPFLPDETIDT